MSIASTIILKRLRILYTAFTHAQKAVPQTMQKLKADSFEHEIAKRLVRYNDKGSHHRGNHPQNLNLEEQTTTPDAYMQRS